MTKGISLHIGLDYVDPNHYAGWDGKLMAAEFDANDMFMIATSSGFDGTRILRSAATRENVVEAIKKAATQLKENDMFLISYSGHGGRLPDLNSDEEDKMDETWCLFDGELIDDELAALWSQFKRGVRILVFSDSCHSGTILKNMIGTLNSGINATPRFMPNEVSQSTYIHNKDFYDKITKTLKGEQASEIKASIKLISGCQDNQYSYDGTFNGVFTASLKTIWNGGKFKGNYETFHKEIVKIMPPEQTPNLYDVGIVNKAFDNQIPFTI